VRKNIRSKTIIERMMRSCSSSSRSGATRSANEKSGGGVKERDLWSLIVNNDDVSFTHILPRLNRTDLKFLYEVNSETRALVKR